MPNTPLYSTRDVQLLRRAVRAPFASSAETKAGSAIAQWLGRLHRRAPLWSLVPSAFDDEDPKDELPAPQMRSRFTRQWMRDESRGWAARRDTVLLKHVARRRFDLARGTTFDDSIVAETGVVAVPGDWPDKLKDEDSDEVVRDYEIGSDLWHLLVEYRGAYREEDREVARSKLDEFLSALGTTLAAQRPPKAPPQDILEQMYEQGHWLMALCWKALGESLQPSNVTSAHLTALGIADDQQRLWSLRLALPILSRIEIIIMLRVMTEPLGQKRRKPVPRRFLLNLLGRRLRAEPKALAERLTDWDTDAFGTDYGPFP